MPFQTQLAIGRKLRVAVTTYVFTIVEAKRKKKEENKNEHGHEDRCIVTVHR